MFNRKSGKQAQKHLRAERKDKRLAERVLRPAPLLTITKGMIKRALKKELYEENKGD